MIKVERPAASKDKINTKDSFELCYLRHQYFRRAKYNPTEAEMQPYMYIVENLSKNTFFTYLNLFKSVGMYQEDVLNIGRVHLVSFMGLYALDNTPEKKKEFAERFLRYEYKEPEEKDFDQKNKANFSIFFKQRMEDLVRVCRQKVRNIKGQTSEEYAIFHGKEQPPKQLYRLLKNHLDFGYKKIDFAIFKSIRKRAGVNNDATIFSFGGTWYVAVPLDQKSLELDDLVNSEYNPYDNLHNAQPDSILEEKEVQKFHKLFNRRSNYRKKALLRNFVAKNKSNRYYKEEVAIAKKLLRSLGE